MTMIICFVLSLGVAGEVWAETWNCGPQNSNGEYSNSVTCTYDEATKTFTIEGDGEMGNYPYIDPQSSSAPWVKKEILHAVVKGNVTSIGDRALGYIYSLQDISGTENITSIGEAAFVGTALTSADFSSATYVKRAAFYEAKNLEYIALGENVVYGYAYDGYYAFVGTKIPNCHISGDYGTCNGYIKSGTGCVTAENCGAGYYADEASKKCIYCPYGKVVYKGQCLDEYPFAKKRYTPAEAAQWLNDDNNTITLTFKKQ